MLPLMMMMMMWMEVMALPFPFSTASSSSSSSLSFSRQKRQEDIPNDKLLCLLNADFEGVDVSICESPPVPSPPSCTCVPAWQCRDQGAPEEVKDDSSSSFVLDLRVNLDCRALDMVCCLQVDPHATPPTSSAATSSCGQGNIFSADNTFLRVESQRSQYGEFPWTVVLFNEVRIEGFKYSIFTAGGSLVHQQLVLTVAHAVKDYTADQLMVRLGDWNLDTETEAVPHQDIGVAKVLIHPGYIGGSNQYYDVALLVLQRPAVLGATVNTICLPLHDQDYLPHKCVVTGWGKKNFNDADRFQNVMKAVSMPLVSHDACQAALQQTRLGPNFLLHDSFCCAGGAETGQDACTGDGGSPLVCPLRSDPSRYVQVGVVAWGVECSRVGVPGVYADVAKVRPWINQIIAKWTGGAIHPRSHFSQ